MNDLSGRHFIAGQAEHGEGTRFTAVDALAGAEIGPDYRDAGEGQVERAALAAGVAAREFGTCEPAVRADLLRRIANGLVQLGDVLVQRVQRETALPAMRIEGERARTVLQLQQFAALIEEGSWVDARIDHGDANRRPQPRPDLRRMAVALGPVAVFGASNFPLAYSVAGGDTASALAAGCPVVVKGHPAHPGTSELVGALVADAVRAVGLPGGVFSLVHGSGHAVGAHLVRHPAIQAVGFTGSHQGGRALFDLAAARPEPIPVFAEMGSANPIVVLPNALRVRGAAIAEQVAQSALLAQGQFCTSPGIVLWLHGEGGEAFAAALRERLCSAPGGPTVHPSIRQGFARSLADVRALPVEVHGHGTDVEGATAVCPVLLRATAEAVLQNARLRSEIYGPAVLTVACRNDAELQQVVEALHGHLTGTVHGDGDDFVRHRAIGDALRRKVGRLICNGVPTGVEVSPAMVHGGPYPAATDARFSAVGTTSIQRWVRPACWQDWPVELLPPELQDGNPRGITRLVDGRREPGRLNG